MQLSTRVPRFYILSLRVISLLYRVISYRVCVHTEVLQVILVNLPKSQLPVSWIAKI